MSPPPSEKKASPAKRTPRKPAARGKWSEEKLLTSDKSVLIYEDLVKLLSKPEAWNLLDEDEKREILALLPADIHPDADLSLTDSEYRIPPLPQQFIRYSTNWREGLRVFQLDLENGRYDPQWLRQAENARRERENGDFDKFKEREFEEFWGQKQRMDMTAAAGEHGRIRLRELVAAGVIQLGDVWRFNFVFGRGENRLVIDKEARVHEINGTLLSFVVATGPRTILTSVHGEILDGAAQETTEPNQSTEAKQEDVKTDLPENASPLESAEPTFQTSNLDLNEKTAQVTVTPSEQNSGNGSKVPNHIVNEKPSITITTTEEIEMKESGENSPRKSSISPHDSPRDRKSSLQVLIVSPRKNANSAGGKAKRTVPSPAPEPPAKRKRCRPREHPIQPKPEPEKEAEAELQTESSSQPGPATQLTESERAKPDLIISSPKKILTPTKLTNFSTPTPPKEAQRPVDFPNTKKATIQDKPTETPGFEAPEDLSPPTSEQEPQSASKPKPMVPVTPYGPNEVVVSGIRTPANLVTYLLQIDGRPKEGARTANAWKEIRCYRKNQDMGSLFEVRQTWYFKQKRNGNVQEQEQEQEQDSDSDSDWKD
ncbi:FAD dependent oxidoreductase [Penicillium atrosanguineum]|nr:FAD dependent oxidoreductase [Penicillium atrosanguineum]KAJ5313651.1 FAD dependent oxidoreductase [Penicillium atrosanguineum]